MKINFIIPGIFQSGGIRIIFSYAKALKEAGHDVVCYYPLTGIYVGWKKILFPKAIVSRLIQKGKDERTLDEKIVIKTPFVINNHTVRDADVNIATYWLTAYWVNRLSSTKGRKVYFVQDYELWGDCRSQELAYKSYMLPMNKVITVSSALSRKLMDEFSRDSVVVCNGIPKGEIGVPEKKGDKICIAMPYREGTRKNSSVGIQVLRNFRSKQICLKAFGFSKPDDWPNDIEFLENPSREQLQQFYKTTDIFYVPSLYEGWGLPAVEAMAHGCVVLAHNSGAIEEFGRDQENCIVLQNPKDPAEAEEKISELIVSTEKRKKIGFAAWKTVVEGYTFEAASKKFEEALKG